MTDLRLALRQIRYENRSFWRNPAAAFFTFAFPLIFLVLFNLLFGDEPIVVAGREVTTSTFYVPAIAAFSIVTATFTNLAMSLTIARDEGLLKRFRGTPLPGWAYLAGRIGHALLVAILLVAVVTAAGIAVYGVDAPAWLAVAAAVAVGAFAFSSLGLAMTAAVPSADAAPAVVNAVVLPLLFISDVFIRTDEAPAWLRAIGDVFPIKHLSEALQSAFAPGAAESFAWGHLGIVAA